MIISGLVQTCSRRVVYGGISRPMGSYAMRFTQNVSQAHSQSSPSEQMQFQAQPKPILNVTDACVAEIKRGLEKGIGKYFRVGVNGGGCDGNTYFYKYDKDDIVPEDLVIKKDGVSIVIDPDSIPKIKGSTLDFVKLIQSQSFQIVNNPNAKHSCGCKTSFEFVPADN